MIPFDRRLAALAAAACFSAALFAATSARAADLDLAGTDWRVAAIDDFGLPVGVEASLSFDEGGGIAGDSGCNRVIGSYEQSGSTLTVGPTGTTMMACPEPAMETQQRYVAALEATRSFRTEGARLMLLDGDGTPVMTLVRDDGA